MPDLKISELTVAVNLTNAVFCIEQSGVTKQAGANLIIGLPITGFSSGAGTVSASDTILQAINKLDGNVAAKFTLPSLTSGSILFSNGTTIEQDNSNLFWDNTNNLLYVGTTTANATGFGRVRIGDGTALIDIGENSATEGCIWLGTGAAAPTSTNYTIKTSATNQTTTIQATSNVSIVSGSTVRANFSTRFSFSPVATSSGSTSVFTFTTPADTTLTAGSEQKGFEFDMSTNTVQHASNTAITMQRDFYISERTHRFATAGGTITDAYTFFVNGAPTAGTNAAITRSWSCGFAANAQFQNLIYVGATGVAPASYIHIAAGTTSRGAIELTSGTNLTTARPGVFEYNGTNLFFTRTGTTRENVLCGLVNAITPTAPDRTITVNISGTDYYIHAKTTND